MNKDKQHKYNWNKEQIKNFIDPTDRIRNCGRSELLAEIYCDIAYENPERQIFIQDHSAYSNNNYEHIMHFMKFCLEKECRKRNSELEGSLIKYMRFAINFDKKYLSFKRVIELSII